MPRSIPPSSIWWLCSLQADSRKLREKAPTCSLRNLGLCLDPGFAKGRILAVKEKMKESNKNNEVKFCPYHFHCSWWSTWSKHRLTSLCKCQLHLLDRSPFWHSNVCSWSISHTRYHTIQPDFHTIAQCLLPLWIEGGLLYDAFVEQTFSRFVYRRGFGNIGHPPIKWAQNGFQHSRASSPPAWLPSEL